MFVFSIIILSICSILALLPSLQNKQRIIEFPFMMGGCLFVWIIPQAYFASQSELDISTAMLARFNFYASACVLAALIGYSYGFKKKPMKELMVTYDAFKSYKLGLILCSIGFSGHVALWLYGEVEGPWTGWPVYFYTLTKISIAGIPLLMISYFKSPRLAKMLFIILFVSPLLIQIFGRGRRGESFVVISLLLVMMVVKLKYSPPRIILPVGIILAGIIAYAFPIWRVNFEEQGFVKSVSSISLGEIFEYQKFKGGPEYTDSVILFEILRKESHFQYGMGLVDNLVHHYIPGQLIGRDFKEDLFIFFSDRQNLFDKGAEYGRVIPYFTAKSGVVDSFLEFSYLGILLFYGLAYLWGRMSRPVYYGSDFSFHFLSLFALNGAHFIYSGVNMRLSLDIPTAVCVLIAFRYCKLPARKKVRHKRKFISKQSEMPAVLNSTNAMAFNR